MHDCGQWNGFSLNLSRIGWASLLGGAPTHYIFNCKMKRVKGEKVISPGFFVYIITFFLFLFSYTWCQLLAYRLGYQWELIRRQNEFLNRENLRLQGQVNSLSSLRKIDCRARSQLNFVPANRRKIIFYYYKPD